MFPIRTRNTRSIAWCSFALSAILTFCVAMSPAAAAAVTTDDGPSVSLNMGRSMTLSAPWSVKGASLTNPEVADVDVLSPRLLLISGNGPGVTDLIYWSDDGETREVRIEVNVDVERLQSKLSIMFPKANLTLQQADGAIIVTGTLGHAHDAPQLHAYLDIYEIPYIDRTILPGIQQVEVQVRLAEVSRAGVRSLGFNFFRTGDQLILGNTVGSSGGGPINPISIGPPGGASAFSNTPFAFTATQGVSSAVSFFAAFPKADLQMFVEALAENEYLRLLAEPTLVALSGEEASFLAGGEFPIPVVQGGTTGGASVTIEYKEFGIKLKFTPEVLGDAKIRLKVSTEVSELSDIGAVELQGFSVPSIVQRTAETTLELRSGQSFAMAGLISETTNAQSSRVPGLSSLPILGPLFRSVSYQSGETELVVMVTASQVEPLSAVNLPPLPGDDHVVPSDWELYSEGRIEGQPISAHDSLRKDWMHEIGLARLQGPGAWASHDQPLALSRARPDMDSTMVEPWALYAAAHTAHAASAAPILLPPAPTATPAPVPTEIFSEADAAALEAEAGGTEDAWDPELGAPESGDDTTDDDTTADDTTDAGNDNDTSGSDDDTSDEPSGASEEAEDA